MSAITPANRKHCSGSSGGPDRWSNLPSKQNPRLLIPRASRAVETAALTMYRPLTARGMGGWQAARILAALGMFRLLPPGHPPPTEVLEALRPHLGGERHAAVSPRPNHPGRYLALILSATGACELVAKVATTDAERQRLRREAHALQTIAPLLSTPLSAPAILDFDGSVLLIESVAWRPALRPWVLPEEVASALGAFFRGAPDRSNPSHGDFTPWNLIRTQRGWVLLDWEEATEEGQPFFDVLHYFVQSHALLGHPSRRALLGGLKGEGPVGAAFQAYATGAGLSASDVGGAMKRYLVWSIPRQDQDSTRKWRGREVRQELLGQLRW